MKTKLEIGQTVWIESRNYNFSSGVIASSLHEAEIVESNTSSAYAVRVDNLEKNKPYRYRISQRTKKFVDSVGIFGLEEILWLSKEEYEKDMQLKADLESFSRQIVEAVKSCKDLEKLKKALGILI